MGVGIINFVCAIPALFLIDRLGRRLLLLSTFPFMALFQAITAIAYAAVKDSETKLGLILTGSCKRTSWTPTHLARANLC